jgi:hypothetical protein
MIIFSRVKDVITYSKEEALRLGHDFIGTEHLMQYERWKWKSNSNFKQS